MIKVKADQIAFPVTGGSRRVVLRPGVDDLDHVIPEEEPDDELTREEARIDHLGEPPEGTPWSGARRRYEQITALAWPLVTAGVQASADGGNYWRHVQRRLEPVALHLACAVIPAGQQLAFIDDSRSDPLFERFFSPDPACRCIACRRLGGDDPARLACPVYRQDRFARRLDRVLYHAFFQQAPHDRQLGMPRRSGLYPWSRPAEVGR